MKSKKLKLSIVVVCLIILMGIITWAVKSVAVDNVDYQFKIVNLRDDSKLGFQILRNKTKNPDGVKGSDVHIWNIVKMNGNLPEELPLYCVQAELGFSEEGVLSDTVKYDKMFDMKLIGDKRELNEVYGTSDDLIIAKTDNSDIYSKVLWVADNMYVPGEDTVEDKINFLKKTGVITSDGDHNEYTLTDKTNLLIATDIITEADAEELSEDEIDKLFYSKFFLSDDVIEVVQQLVFWNIIHENDENENIKANYVHGELPDLYFTESENGKFNELDGNSPYKEFSGVPRQNVETGENLGPGEWFYGSLGENYQKNADTLYKYLIAEANKNTSYYDDVKYSSSISNKIPVQLISNSQTILVDQISNQDNYIVGPYEIKRTSKRSFDLKATVSVENYKVLNSDKEEVSSIESVIGQETGNYKFYLSIPKTEDISDLSVKFEVNSNNRIVNLFLGEDALNEQPILLVKNDKAGYEYSVGMNDKIFDLALRKVIIGVKDKDGNDKFVVDKNGNINNRTVDVDTTDLNKIVDRKLVTTATYNHRKEPVLIETGDIVTYAIKVYNEGDAEGRATIIADALPRGVEFVRVVEGDYEVIQTLYSSDNRIFFGKKSEDNLKAFDGKELDSEEIIIECKVVSEKTTKDQLFTNIALIWEEYNEETDTTITYEEKQDRDSEPYTFPDEALAGIPEDYIGNEGNDADLSKDDYFYEGQQDDDDFEKLILKAAEFDVSLRKYITEIETTNDKGNTVSNKHDREPKVDVEKLNTYDAEGNLITTAEYNHPKTAVSLKKGDIVEYTIRVYNEGDADAYISEITDYLPKWLKFLPKDEINEQYLWTYKEEGNDRVVVTEIGDKNNATGQKLYGTEGTETYRENGQLVKAYDPETKTLDSLAVKIRCEVVADLSDTEILKPGEKVTNIAVITRMTDKVGNEVQQDRDSKVGYENLPSDDKLPTYKDDEINSGMTYIPGQEDDDDFEKVVIQVFDLALRKFITEVDDGKEVTSYGDSRTPSIAMGTNGKDLDYTHPKNPIGVQNGDLVTYVIRVYNEGNMNGYARKVIDVIPDGLQFHSATVDGEDYRWEMYKEVTDSSEFEFEYKGKKYAETTSKEEATVITTDYLSKAQADATKRDNLLKAFDKEDFEKNGAVDTAEKKNPDYRDLKVTCLVTEPDTSTRILTNVAEIFEDEDEDGNEVDDEDSTPGNDNFNFEDTGDNEDDIDYDSVKLLYYDFALAKFITEVEGTPVNNRYPEVKPGTEGRDLDYEHTKEEVDLISGNTVIYTIRVYNEGINAGYASEVMDDLPDGLLFLPEHKTNIEYRWVMYKESENGTYEYAEKKYEKTDKVEEADIAITDYLDKEVSEADGRDSLMKPFDKEDFEKNGAVDTAEKKNPDYRDIKIAFKVTEPNSSDRIIDNTAEITREEDEDGNIVKDKDSTPGNNKVKEDDIDKEYIKVKQFDLALLKWVTEARITQDGKTKVIKTGHTAETSKNEAPVLATIDSDKIDSVEVKFVYDIRVENQDEIEGYVKEIKDHIPEGLVFKQEDNPDWKLIDDRTAVTDKLKDTLLKKGDVEIVQIVLTWVNSSKNLNLKTNYAEISKDYNQWGVPDKDSRPNDFNGTPKDDDEDDAPVLLTLKTGQMPKYFILGFAILAVLITGIYLIRKYVYRI